MSAYKTEAVAKQQASKKFGKNWTKTYSILESDEGFEIVAKLAELPEAPNSEPEDLEESLPQSGSVCSTLFGAMLNPESVPAAPAPAPKKEAEKTGKTIEANRPEQNGLKRPSKGSTCCIIWDTCDRISAEKESTCTSAELFNALQGYNECTLRTQYARWRQFNGITGRLPGQNKAAKLPAEFDDAKDVLLSRIVENDAAYASLEAVKTAADLISWIANNSAAF
jgi:hypothetical protein